MTLIKIQPANAIIPMHRARSPIRRRHDWWHSLLVILLLRQISTAAPTTTDTEGFAIPQPGRRFTFPRDHGSHPDFSIEWWYITGHLAATNGGQYGFQATFFRRSAPRTTNATQAFGARRFGDQQIFLAHMALVDVSRAQFHHQERLNRDGWDASASTNTLDVRNGNWSLRLVDASSPERMELRGGIAAKCSFQLNLTPRKPLVVFGTNGVSRKAADSTAASHYLTFPRLMARGTVSIDGHPAEVSGEAWMDHEFSSSQLGEGQVGWDWTSVQLNDGRELMAYRMRRRDGSTDPFSTIAWVDGSGSVRHAGADQFRLEALTRWRSPVSGAQYPARVKLIAMDPTTGKEEAWVLEPLVADQELHGDIGGVAYWEGACRVLDESGRIVGKAYMELTGYAAELRGRF